MALGFLNKMIGLKVAAPPTERTHRVAGRELPLRIVENARAKRLTLRIEPGGRGLVKWRRFWTATRAGSRKS